MQKPILYRKRLIPNECIRLTEDEIIYQDSSVIVTRWNTLRPKKTLHHGISCYFLSDGFKISKFYGHDDDLICWYCDIIDYTHKKPENIFVFRDLLADVLVYPNGNFKVVDLDELADAFEQDLLDSPTLQKALRQTNHLLSLIYSGYFEKIQEFINEKERLY